MARKYPDLPDMDIYDREGNKISFQQYVELLGDSKNWMDYRRVAFDQYGDFDVSTIWLGINHNWSGKGDPVIFETMIFVRVPDDEDRSSVYCRRYTNEQEALEGHKEALETLKTPHIIESQLTPITEEEAENEDE
jgi:hypothetical protein